MFLFVVSGYKHSRHKHRSRGSAAQGTVLWGTPPPTDITADQLTLISRTVAHKGRYAYCSKQQSRDSLCQCGAIIRHAKQSWDLIHRRTTIDCTIRARLLHRRTTIHCTMRARLLHRGTSLRTELKISLGDQKHRTPSPVSSENPFM